MTKKIDKIREHRIEMDIVVDAYGSVGENTKEAIEDWHYWAVMGYQF